MKICSRVGIRSLTKGLNRYKILKILKNLQKIYCYFSFFFSIVFFYYKNFTWQNVVNRYYLKINII